MILQHLTLCTGHNTTHRVDTFDPVAVEACRVLIAGGGGPITAFPAFRVVIVPKCPAFTIYRGSEPLVTCALWRDLRDRPAWDSLAALQAKFGPVMAMYPTGTFPVLLVAILPSLSMLAQSDIGWLGDFERCMGAAYLSILK